MRRGREGDKEEERESGGKRRRGRSSGEMTRESTGCRCLWFHTESTKVLRLCVCVHGHTHLHVGFMVCVCVHAAMLLLNELHCVYTIL